LGATTPFSKIINMCYSCRQVLPINYVNVGQGFIFINKTSKLKITKEVNSYISLDNPGME
jgi:hypothetical protein